MALRWHAAIEQVFAALVARVPHFDPEEPLPTLTDDLALTTSIAEEGADARVQVLRRQPDGSWLWLLDKPELIRRP